MTESTELVPSSESITEPLAIPATTLEILTRSELDTMILSARRFPRSMALFRQNAMAMIREDVETAAACYYTLKRKRADGGMATIEGPTIRLAEIAKANYGNLRSGGRVLEVRQSDIVAQGFAHDLQMNTFDGREVHRRIQRSDGRRYSDDMITMTGNAAIAIAERNAIFNVIPKALIDPLWRYAKQVVAGSIKTLSEARKRALALAEEMKVPAARVCLAFGRAGVDDLTVEDLVELRGMLNSLRDGQATIDEVFPQSAPPPEAAVAPTEHLRDVVRRRRGPEAAAEKDPPAEEPPS